MRDVQEPSEQVADDGYYEKNAAQQEACNQANSAFPGPLTPYGMGVIGANRAMTIAESEQHRRDCAAQQAIYILEQARQIRANPTLMADVRAHIRKLRDDGAALLDDLG